MYVCIYIYIYTYNSGERREAEGRGGPAPRERRGDAVLNRTGVNIKTTKIIVKQENAKNCIVPVSVRKQKLCLTSNASGAGEQFLPLGCMAKARVKGLFVSQVPV